MRATALREPGLVRRANHDVVVTPADWSRSGADPQTNWTKRRGPVIGYLWVYDSNGKWSKLETVTLP